MQPITIDLGDVLAIAGFISVCVCLWNLSPWAVGVVISAVVCFAAINARKHK